MTCVSPPMAPPPWLGSGEVEHRYEPSWWTNPPKPLPWYYNQAAQAAIAGAVIAILIAVGVING